MTVYLALLVCIVGGIIYLAVEKYAKVAELGRCAFWCGLLAFLFTWGRIAIH